jgi:hypothetical protein
MSLQQVLDPKAPGARRQPTVRERSAPAAASPPGAPAPGRRPWAVCQWTQPWPGTSTSSHSSSRRVGGERQGAAHRHRVGEHAVTQALGQTGQSRERRCYRPSTAVRSATQPKKNHHISVCVGNPDEAKPRYGRGSPPPLCGSCAQCVSTSEVLGGNGGPRTSGISRR